MTLVHVALLYGSLAALLMWAGLGTYVLWIQRRQSAARATVSAALAALEGDDVASLAPGEQVERVRPWLRNASRELVMYAAANATGPAAPVLRSYLVERWTTTALERDAAAHRTARDKWRRMTALRVLADLRHPRQMELLAAAVDGRDADVASVAFSLLGESAQ